MDWRQKSDRGKSRFNTGVSLTEKNCGRCRHWSTKAQDHIREILAPPLDGRSKLFFPLHAWMSHPFRYICFPRWSWEKMKRRVVDCVPNSVPAVLFISNRRILSMEEKCPACPLMNLRLVQAHSSPFHQKETAIRHCVLGVGKLISQPSHALYSANVWHSQITLLERLVLWKAETTG